MKAAPRGRSALLLALTLLLGGALAVFVVSRGPVLYQPNADEGYYLRYAGTLSAEGFAGLARTVRAYLDDPAAGVFPSPTRVGYLLPAAVALRLGDGDFAALAHLSLAAHVALVLVCFLFARRRLGDWPALAVALLVGTSPLLLGLARRALADGVVTLFLAVALCCWLELLRPASRGGWVIAFAAAFAAAVLAKESSLLFLAPLGLVALAHDLFAPQPLARARLVVAAAAPVVLAAGVWMALAGSPSGVVRLARATLGAPAQNAYAVAFGSGPWSRYLIDFLLLSPWVLLLALAGLGTLALRRSPATPGRGTARDLALFAAGTLAVFAPLTKNARYLAILTLPLAVLAVVFLLELAAARRRAAAMLCAGAVALLAVAQLRAFDRLFVEAAIYDPVTTNLLRAEGMVPPR